MKRNNEHTHIHTRAHCAHAHPTENSWTENWGRRRHPHRLFNFVRHFRCRHLPQAAAAAALYRLFRRYIFWCREPTCVSHPLIPHCVTQCFCYYVLFCVYDILFCGIVLQRERSKEQKRTKKIKMKKRRKIRRREFVCACRVRCASNGWYGDALRYWNVCLRYMYAFMRLCVHSAYSNSYFSCISMSEYLCHGWCRRRFRFRCREAQVYCDGSNPASGACKDCAHIFTGLE